MIPVPESKLEICWWSCSFGVSILQRSSVDWDTSVALKLQFCSCSLDDFCSKCQKNQTVWVSSKAVYNSVGNMKFNWVPLPRECSLAAPLSPSFLCTWFQDALFQVLSLGCCASILSMWGTGCTWASTTSFIEIHPSDQKVPLMFLKHKLESDTAI